MEIWNKDLMKILEVKDTIPKFKNALEKFVCWWFNWVEERISEHEDGLKDITQIGILRGKLVVK